MAAPDRKHQSVRTLAPALALVVLAGGGGAYAAVALARGDEASPALQSLPSASYPAPPPPVEQQLPTALPTAPRRGTVEVRPGPFDDRFRLEDVRLANRRAVSEVTGRLTVTSDVSELIKAEVVVGFYDTQGRLLGTGTDVLEEYGHAHAAEEPVEIERTEGEPQEFSVQGPAEAASATLTVPTLVNE